MILLYYSNFSYQCLLESITNTVDNSRSDIDSTLHMKNLLKLFWLNIVTKNFPTIPINRLHYKIFYNKTISPRLSRGVGTCRTLGRKKQNKRKPEETSSIRIIFEKKKKEKEKLNFQNPVAGIYYLKSAPTASWTDLKPSLFKHSANSACVKKTHHKTYSATLTRN